MDITLDRRTFVGGAGMAAVILATGFSAEALAGTHTLLRPPGGQDETAFIGDCLRCDRCRSVCPQNCIVTATVEDGIINVRTPTLDFQRGACDFCDACRAVCPSGALRAFDATTERIGTAVLVASECTSCGRCAPVCAPQAISLDDLNRPVIDTTRCNGCGACEHVCPSESLAYYNGASRPAIRVVLDTTSDA